MKSRRQIRLEKKGYHVAYCYTASGRPRVRITSKTGRSNLFNSITEAHTYIFGY